MPKEAKSAEVPSWLVELATESTDKTPSWLVELASDNPPDNSEDRSMDDDGPRFTSDNVPDWLAEIAQADGQLDIDSDNHGISAPRYSPPDKELLARVAANAAHRVSARQMRALFKLNCMVPTGQELHNVATADDIVAAELADIEHKGTAYVSGYPFKHWACCAGNHSLGLPGYEDGFIVVTADSLAGNYDIVIHHSSGGEVPLSGKDTKYLSHVFANYDEGCYTKKRPSKLADWPRDNETLDEYTSRTS